MAPQRSELRDMGKKTKGKFKRASRFLVLQWLRSSGVDVSQGTSNYELLAAYNLRSTVKATTIVVAADLIDPNFNPNHAAQAERDSKKKRKSAPKQKPGTPSFYKSVEWKRARYDALKAGDGRCELCGVSKHDGAKLNVDHIKSLRDRWDLRLVQTNLQVLCGSCNCGKGNRDDTDWREPSLRVLMGEAMK